MKELCITLKVQNISRQILQSHSSFFTIISSLTLKKKKNLLQKHKISLFGHQLYFSFWYFLMCTITYCLTDIHNA